MELRDISAPVRRKVQAAIAAIEARGERVTGRRIRTEGKVDQHTAVLVARHHKAGTLAWPAEPEPDTDVAALAAAIRCAHTDAERERIHHDAAALAVEGKIAKWQLECLQRALSEARQSAKASRDVGGDEDPETGLMAGPDAYLLVRGYEALICDKRRAAVVDFVKEQLRADLDEHPNRDAASE